MHLKLEILMTFRLLIRGSEPKSKVQVRLKFECNLIWRFYGSYSSMFLSLIVYFKIAESS